MKKIPLLVCFLALLLTTTVAVQAADGPPADVAVTIFARLLEILENVVAVLPEFLRPFFEAIISFLRTLFGG